MKIKIYTIARISKDAHLWTDKVCGQLDDSFEVFKPKDHNPWNKKHESFSKNIYEVDLKAMKKSHIGLMIPEYGRDCAWECGWFANSKKPLVVFVEKQVEWLRDWMVKGGVSYVVTSDLSTYKVIKKDPILKYKKVFLIKKMVELNRVVKRVYEELYVSI